MGISVPLLAIAAIFTGRAGVLAVCAALALIAVASTRYADASISKLVADSRRRRGGPYADGRRKKAIAA